MNPISDRQPIQCTHKWETHSPEQTISLGRIIGKHLNQSLTLLLYGDLASGKTTFTQGLAQGIDVPASYPVTSPTYTLINEYPGRLPFYHVDLYRLTAPIDLDEIGLEEIFYGKGIVAVEWADRLDPSDRPALRLELRFSVIDDNRCQIRTIEYGLDSSDLLHDIDICAGTQ